MEDYNLTESTNFVVLSDHGLIKTTMQFFIEDCLADYSKVLQIANSLSFVMVYPVEGITYYSYYI
jgi:predicted AlkP superfamily pyrophosphatase or phosphodiesterase